MGDAIEIGAINRVFGGKRTRPLFVGAAKAVVGHTEECAGLTGLLKAVQCFEHNVLPPQPHLYAINKELDLRKAKIVLPRTVQAFCPPNGPRLIGVSSFGLSGTLAHIILEEPERPEPTFTDDEPGLFLMSANTPNDLLSSIRKFLKFYDTVRCQEMTFADACRTSQVARDHLSYRMAWSAESWRHLVHCLANTLGDEVMAPRCTRNPGVSLWFGLPHPGQVADVGPIRTHSKYAETLEDCSDSGCVPELEPFADQLAVAWTLEALGCRVTAVGGEGVGEYVAACFAGALHLSSLFTILKRLFPSPGTQSSIIKCSKYFLEDTLLAFGPDEARIVAEYGPETFCVAGLNLAMEELRRDLGSKVQLMEGYDLSSCAPTRGVFDHLETSSPRMPIVSSSLGDVIDKETLASQHYWSSIPERFVRAGAACEVLEGMSDALIDLSVQGHNLVCKPLINGSMDEGASRRVGFAASANPVFGRLYEVGCNLDWKSLASAGPTAHLPGYPW